MSWGCNAGRRRWRSLTNPGSPDLPGFDPVRRAPIAARARAGGRADQTSQAAISASGSCRRPSIATLFLLQPHQYPLPPTTPSRSIDLNTATSDMPNRTILTYRNSWGDVGPLLVPVSSSLVVSHAEESKSLRPSLRGASSYLVGLFNRCSRAADGEESPLTSPLLMGPRFWDAER